MQVIYSILVIAGMLAIGWVIQKIGGATLVGVNRVVFHGEYAKDKKLREGMTFHTSASVPAVLEELDTYVCAVDAPLGFSDVLYVANRTDTGIAWIYGSAAKVKLQAVVGFSTDGPDTEAIFAVTQWLEEDGFDVAVDALKQLRMQVVAAFKAADPDVSITDGLPDTGEAANAGEPEPAVDTFDTFETTD